MSLELRRSAPYVPIPSKPMDALTVAAACAPAPIWVNTTTQLRRYLTDGTEVGSPVELARFYGDIAWSADGSTLYGLDFSAGNTLHTIDPVTGAETGTITVTGASTAGQANALAAAADGTLLYGRSSGTAIWKVNPTTGVATVFANFPTGVTSAGDAITLDDGDILALGVLQSAPLGERLLYRIHPDATLTEVGTIPEAAFGAAVTGGDVYVATNTGELLKLDSVPTGLSTDPIPTTTVVDTALSFDGATSVQDAGNCLPGDPIRGYDLTKTSSPASPAAPGDVVTYRVTVRNDGTADFIGAASFDDDLSDVLDDATLVPNSPTASSGTVSVLGTTLSWSGTLPSGNSAVVTITYQVRIEDPDGGNLVLVNAVAATTAGGGCLTTCSTRTVVRPHPTPASCPPASLWLNSAAELTRYTVDGTQIGTAVPVAAYNDIAWSADGTTLYGVNSTGATKTISTIDPQTGAVLAAVAVTPPAGDPFTAAAGGLSAAADGSLYLGVGTSIVKVNPATGIATAFATLPTGYSATADFLTLADGDVLAISYRFPNTGLFRIAPDGTMTEVGTVPVATGIPSGAALSGGEVYLTIGTTVYKVENVPTGASTAAVHIDAAFVTTSPNSGATSVQDAGSPGGCVVDSDMSYTVAKSSDASGNLTPGDTVTYTVTVKNTGVLPYPNGYAGFSDDLSDVLDDATLVAGSVHATTGAANITGSALIWVGGLPATGSDSTVTVTYQVKVDSPDPGNQSLVNAAQATGAAGTCPGTCTTRSPVVTPTKTANTGTDSQRQLILAGLLLGAGGLMTLAGRRRRPTRQS